MEIGQLSTTAPYLTQQPNNFLGALAVQMINTHL